MPFMISIPINFQQLMDRDLHKSKTFGLNTELAELQTKTEASDNNRRKKTMKADQNRRLGF